MEMPGLMTSAYSVARRYEVNCSPSALSREVVPGSVRRFQCACHSIFGEDERNPSIRSSQAVCSADRRRSRRRWGVTEDELGLQMQFSSFQFSDATQMDNQLRCCCSLGAVLWGRLPKNLERQLAAHHPEIPSGFSLSDFWEFLQLGIRIGSIDWNNPGYAALRSSLGSTSMISVSAQTYTKWEARCEIVRRAIEYLENTDFRSLGGYHHELRWFSLDKAKGHRVNDGLITPIPWVCLGSESAKWLRGRDLNPRPLGYEPNELPGCSTPQHDSNDQGGSSSRAAGLSRSSKS
jgi:hypothetical protein